MRRIAMMCVFAVVFSSLLLTPAIAADDDKKFSIDGGLRARWEYVSNVTDAADHPPATNDDDVDFWPYRARIAAHGHFSDDVSGMIELQHFGVFGDDFPTRTSGDPFGQTSAFSSRSDTDLYQGYVQLNDLWDSSWSVRIGRQEHTLGNELHLGDLDFYNGISMDGVRAMADFGEWDLDVFYYVAAEDFAGPAPIDDDDTNLGGITASFNVADKQSLEPYFLLLRDGANTGAGVNGSLMTIGALWGREPARGKLDWSLEAAMQTGDEKNPATAATDYAGSIIEGWLGYSFKRSSEGTRRVHIGAFIASGDDTPGDTDMDAFMPLFPDNHAHNRLGDLDLFGGATVATGPTGGAFTNVTDFSIGYSTEFGAGAHGFMASLHKLSVTDTAAADDEIGLELDLKYDYNYSENVDFQVAIANLFSDDALGASADDILRIWGQAQLRF